MFNNQVDEEKDFCEAYKSEILGNSTVEEKPSNTLSKVFTILLLLILIIAVSIYGYNSFIKNSDVDSSIPPSSIQIDDEELVVTEEEEKPVEVLPPKTTQESDIDNMAKEVESAISKSEKSSIKKIEKPLEVPTTTQSDYLDDLEKLSKEIDK